MKALLVLLAAFVPIAAVTLITLRHVGALRIWPAALLIVTAPLEVYRSSSAAGGNLSVFRLALAVAIVAFVLELVRRKRRVPGSIPVVFTVYGAFVGWQIISYLFVTANQSLAHRFIGQYAAGLIAAFLITMYVRRGDLRVVVGVCGAGAVLPLIAAVFRVVSVRHGGSGDLPGLTELPLNLTIEAARQSGSFLLDGTQRLNGTFSDPNLFGFYVGVVLCVMLGRTCSALFVEKPIRWTVAFSSGLLAGAAAVALVGTYSRSAWLLAVVGVVTLGALLGRSFWTRRRVIWATVAGLVALGLASPFLLSRLATSEPGNVKSAQVHEHTIRLALKLAVEHPFTGVGLAGYGHYAGEPAIISSAVSTYFTVVAELGIPGLILLLGAVLLTSIAAVRSVWATPPSERVILAGVVAAFVGLAAANILYEAWMDDFQWALFGVILATTTQPRLALAAALRQRTGRSSGLAHRSRESRQANIPA